MPACLPKATALLVLLTRETERHINLSVGSLHDAMRAWCWADIQMMDSAPCSCSFCLG